MLAKLLSRYSKDCVVIQIVLYLTIDKSFEFLLYICAATRYMTTSVFSVADSPYLYFRQKEASQTPKLAALNVKRVAVISLMPKIRLLPV